MGKFFDFFIIDRLSEEIIESLQFYTAVNNLPLLLEMNVTTDLCPLPTFWAPHFVPTLGQLQL